MASLEAGRRFIHREARLIDRRAYAVALEDGPPEAVARALAAYQNADGGFGHAIEPDTRTAASQPLYVETALAYMADFGAPDRAMARRACDFLAAVATPEGGVPILLPSYRDDAYAAHWEDGPGRPGVNPNGGLWGLLRKLGVDHPLLEPLEAFCWSALDRLEGAHDVSEALIFLEHARDRGRADAIAERLISALPSTPLFKADPAAAGYGLDALFFAPRPDSFCARWLEPTMIRRALEHLETQQQPDGGWPISWTPPSAAAVSEWRGIVSLRALRTLRAWGRI